MQPLRIVVAHGDCIVAEALTASLHAFFPSVLVARTPEELHNLIVKEHVDAVVIDLEMMDLHEISALCNEFNSLPVITTHRIPDEQMWTSALACGASDCCDYHDVRNIVGAIARGTHRQHWVARAA